MAQNSDISEDGDEEHQDCKGCQVWGVPHIQEKPLGWSDMKDDSDGSDDSDKTITQESYLESYMASQMLREEEEGRQRQQVSSSF